MSYSSTPIGVAPLPDEWVSIPFSAPSRARIIQITSDDFGGLYALRDDGTIWHKAQGAKWLKWLQVSGIED